MAIDPPRAVTALRRARQGLADLRDLPGVERDRHRTTVEETGALLDTALLLGANRLGDILHHGSDHARLLSDARVLDDPHEWALLQRHARLASNLRAAGLGMQDLARRVLDRLDPADRQAVQELIHALLRENALVSDLLASTLRDVAQRARAAASPEDALMLREELRARRDEMLRVRRALLAE